jgi:hypothetical protein
MYGKHTAGVTESLQDSFEIFLILEGENPPTWVQFIQNECLIGYTAIREDEGGGVRMARDTR